MDIRILLFIILASALTCCSDRPSDIRLSKVEELASASPKEALDSLGAINYDMLTEADRQYYDFLSVKVPDKAYIKHSSDSLILKVIDFESEHQGNGRYPEALYYGGRVYSDLGDCPTALSYFHKALNIIPKDRPNHYLRANVLSQTGRLLTELCLYDEAIPYINEAIMIGGSMNDTVNLVYDLQLLGGTYLRNKKYHDAENCFDKALDLSGNLPLSFRAKSKMYLAAVKYETGQLDSAMNLIRNTEKQVNSVARNSALAYASKIYLKKGLMDSAYFYADKIIHSRDSTQLEIGYQVMLSPEMRNLISSDSINKYISDYRLLLETYYDSNKSTLSINQQNFYNYRLQESARRDAESLSIRLKSMLYLTLFIIIILSMIILLYKNRNQKNLIKLHSALDNLSKLKINLEVNESASGSMDCGTTPSNPPGTPHSANIKLNGKNLICLSASYNSINKAAELRERLKNELLDLYEMNPKITLDKQIIESEAFHKLQQYIKADQSLSYKDPFWNELEEAVSKSSPDFKNNLQLLTQGCLSSIDLHTALLIKCQVSPGQMSILLNRTKGTIVSRRDTLCIKIFNKRLGTKIIDGIIRLL